MNYDVTVNGRPWKVALEPAGEVGRFTVVLKGRRRAVDVAWIDRDTLSLIDVDEDQAPVAREIGLVGTKAGELDVVVDGVAFRAVVTNAAQKRDREGFSREGKKTPADPSAGLDGRQEVVALMPGRIVRVLVTSGDRVVAGQGVVTMEAMKMENELRSPKGGTVVEVRVMEGIAVDAGAVLVVID